MQPPESFLEFFFLRVVAQAENERLEPEKGLLGRKRFVLRKKSSFSGCI